MGFVTLLSDFGTVDGYVAQMKAVILRNCPEAAIVDISHSIERHNILMGSFVLATTVPYFPKETIHVAVVDPGVGSARKAIVVKCKNGLLIGPDNGLLDRASRKLKVSSIQQITARNIYRNARSNTFHGRDIFAQVAGLIASGEPPEEFGPRIPKIEKLNLPQPRVTARKLRCHVLHVDNFGNLITDVEQEMLQRAPLTLGNHVGIQAGIRRRQGRFVRSYHEVGNGELAVLLGSQGFLEIAAREGSAQKILDVNPLDALELQL